MAALALDDIRALAAANGYSELCLNRSSRVISFYRDGCRVNVYYTTGTVGTCLNHPNMGRTQLFRRNVTLDELRQILAKPRVHTDKGYRKKASGAGDPAEDDDPPDEYEALKAHKENLIQRVRLLDQDMKEIEAAAEKKRLAAEAAAREMQRQLRVLEEMRKRALLAQRNRKLNKRGNNSICDLIYDDDFPAKMTGVKSVALGGGGYLAIFDNGTYCSDGLPNAVKEALEDDDIADDLKYAAIGQCGQYYLVTKKGTEIWWASKAFGKKIRKAKSSVKFVSFAHWGNYFIAFKDGSCSWGGKIPAGVSLKARECQSMDYLWFSNDGESYIIGYDGTWQMVLPPWVSDSVKIPFRNKKVTQVQMDDAAHTFFIRYS